MDVKEAMSKLSGLKADEIATFLVEQGVRGEFGSAHRCAIANYIRKTTGENSVSVTDFVTIWQDARAVLHKEAIPLNVFEFIDRFDDGDYPELEES